MSLKFTEDLYVMTMKNNAKFEEKLTIRLKLTPQFDKFCSEHPNVSKICTLMGFKLYNV